MYITHNRVFPVGNFVFVQSHEVIKSGDLIRRTTAYQGSDYYDGHADSKTNWMLVDEFAPYWVGKTIMALCKKIHEPDTNYEVIRNI